MEPQIRCLRCKAIANNYIDIQASKKAQASAPHDAPSLEPCILKNLVEVDPEDDRRMEGMELWRELFSMP